MSFVRLIMLAGVLAGVAGQASAASFYVDDGSTNGNVFTTAAGNDANAGTTPGAPKRTITNLLTSVSLAAGDIVYIDTGIYSNYTVTITNSGGVGNPIIFQGSTNLMAGGSVISRDNLSFDVIGLRGNHLEFRNLTIENGIRGFNGSLQFPPPSGMSLEQVTVRGNSTALQRGQWTVRRSLFFNNATLRDPNSSSYDFDFCTFWGHTADAGVNAEALITMNNSVYVGGDLLASISGDYNVFWDVRLLSQGRAYLYEHNLPNSTFYDPGFANVTASNFYAVSVSGRYNPATGNFVTDSVHSVLIDFGNPSSTLWTNESSPNGSRVNIGANAGIGLASRSRTNSWLFALTFNDGGAVTGTTQALVWNYGLFTNGSTVRLDYSVNDGVTWSNITTSVAVTNRSYTWNVTGLSPTAALWRVVAEADTNLWSQNRQRFSLGGSRVPYYLNDASTNDAFYTSTVGNDTNSATRPSMPKLTLTNLLASSFVLGKHDIIYIDTGIYSNYTIDVRRFGATNQPVIFQGVPKSGASVFRRNASASIFQLFGNHYLFRDLTLEGAGSNGSIYDGIGSSSIFVEGCILRSNNVAFRRGTVSVRNSIMATNVSVIVADAGSFSFDQCVFWRNGQIQPTVRPWSVSNSVFVGGAVNGLTPLAGSDSCMFWETSFDGFISLHDVQEGLSKFSNSTVLDPKFHDPVTYNFHPKSITGRYNPATQAFVADAEHSPLIDFGATSSTAWTNETAPNGGRLNIGVYGGTAFASRSRTNAWLQTMSYNDGGQLSVPTDYVTWNYGSLPTGTTVRIEFSFNGGSTWNTLGSNITATSGSYLVTSTNFASSRFARWRVVLEQDTTVASTNLLNFTYRNGPYRYYVNDASTAGDVYSTAPGNDANLGTTPDAPKATITGVFTNYQLEAGDIVFVDTGLFQSSTSINVPILVSGTNGNPVVIQGSTNLLFGGSIIRGPVSGVNAPGFTFVSGVNHVRLSDIIVQRRTTGVLLSNNFGIELMRMRIESNSLSGVSASGSGNVKISHTVIRTNDQDGIFVSGSSGDVCVVHSVIWMNGFNAVRSTGPRVTITNSAMGARGARRNIYNATTFTNIVANYNVVRVEQNASVATIGITDRLLNTLSAWQAESGTDRMSLDIEPHFVNANGGDFHLRSQTIQGRFDPILGWVTDTITSPLIDAGDPATAYGNETAPNGGRVNIGLYGNTPEASRVDFDRIYAGNIHQGGYVKGTSTLHWVAAGLASNEYVQVDVSANGGESWMTLSTGVLASTEQLAWNTTTNDHVVAGLWRVQSVSNPSLSGQTTNFFGIRNAPLTYYLNDSSLSGNQFTVGPGSATNWVATTNRPLNSLAAVFDRYDVEPGDRIFVDRGTYSISSPVNIGLRGSGAPTAGVVTIIGATSCPTGATTVAELVGSGSISQTGIVMDQARFIVVSNMAIRKTGMALSIMNGQSIQFDGVRIHQAATNSVQVSLSTNVEFRRSQFSGSAAYGWAGISNSNTRLINTLFVSNNFGSVFVSGGSVGVTNSVFVVNEPSLAIFNAVNNGVIRSDYNNLHVDPLANIARYNGRLHKFTASWQAETTNDLRSLSHDPGFLNLAGGDYHVLSSAGRFSTNGCVVVTDAVDSVMIDSGSPVSSVGDEPAPNGGRVNIGLYGGSVEASMSATNGRLLTLSLNNGGTVRGTNTLYWSANQVVTGHLVYIDVSDNNGVTWTNIATNVSSAVESFVWNSSSLPSAALYRWRIGSQSDPALTATNAVPFTLNNGSISYFVNDTSTNGDVYATAVGLPENDGLSPNTPASTVASIFNRYAPSPGDIIYIDTGEYLFTATTSLDANNSGQTTNPVVVKGSTNWMVGGSRFNMNGSGPLFLLANANSITFSDLVLTNSRFGFNLQLCTNIQFRRITVSGVANLNSTFSSTGFRLDSSTGVYFDRVVVAAITNRSDSAAMLVRQLGIVPAGLISLQNSILWSNTFGFWAQTPTPLSISNSVIQTGGDGSVGLILPDATQLQSDFNVYRVASGARLAQLSRVISATLPSISMPFYFTTMQAWRNYTGRDTNSITYDPGFANPASLDFGLLSTAGRWSSTGLVTDLVSSVLIDAGNPVWASTNEPAPNGGRVNIGLDGNSDRASLSSTNPAVFMLSLHDGGIAQGTNFPLRWDLVGNFTGKTFLIQVSTNAGLAWLTVTSGVSAAERVYRWNTTTLPSGFNRLWRLVCQQDGGITTVSEQPFAIRNTNISFYVNDTAADGDVYTTTNGSSAFSGLAPDQPKASIQEIVAAYALEGGDTVYVDTGVYPTQGDITITRRDETLFPGMITFFGSTNIAAGGSVLQQGGFIVRDSRDIALQHFTVQGTAPAGVNINSSTNILAEWIKVAGAGHGLYLQSAVSVTFRHSLVIGSRTNGIELNNNNRQIFFDHGVVWTNQGFTVNPVNSIAISNSVLAASGTGRFIYSGFSNENFRLNHNVYMLTNGARLARLSFGLEPYPREFVTLASWRNIFAVDSGSMAGDPGYADPSQGDFHPRSTGGRWSVASSNFVTDSVSSILIDSGDPSSAYTEELDPNGSRLNIGLYGNSAFASKSPASPDYLLVSLNDGGSVFGTNVSLSWVARGAVTGHTAKVEVSIDGGANWIVLASNVPPSTTSIPWNTTNLTSTVVGLWRISSEIQPLVTTTAAQFFAIRNGPVIFYINDHSMTGDRVTTTNGSSSATGISASAPLDSLVTLLARYDVEPDDIVYVDTGTYSNNTTIVIDQLDAGLRLVGSTNTSAGGSRYTFDGPQIGLQLLQAPFTQIENIQFGPVTTAININNSDSVVLKSIQTEEAGTAVSMFESENVNIRNSSMRNGNVGVSASACTGLMLEHLVLWSNQQAGVKLFLSSASTYHSVFGLFSGAESFGFDFDVTSTMTSDYNLFHRTSDSVVARRLVSGSTLDLRWQNVSIWSRETSNDVHSLTGDPGFSNPDYGDFHPRSTAGRFDLIVGTFVNDVDTSVLIDAGSPFSSYTNESSPNGGRVDIGMYGNMPEASRSPTNSRLEVVRLNDGGRAEGALVPLTWVATGGATGHTVRLESSVDNGSSWSIIQSNVPANAEILFWDSSTNAVWFGRWRVISEQQPGVSDSNTVAFAVRNTGLSLYVNDASVLGDVYTTSIGDGANNGTSPNLPRLSLQSVIDDYDLEPGDTVYVDSGEHILSSTFSVGRFDAWNSMSSLGALQAGGISTRILGSTNDAVGGSRFIRIGTGNAMELNQALGVNLSYLSIHHITPGAGIAIDLLDSPYVLVDWCRLTGCSKGVNMLRSNASRMQHVLARNNTQHGVLIRNSIDVELEQSVLWSNTVGLTVENRSSVSAYNNVVGAIGLNSVGWQRNDGPVLDQIGELTANYNLLWSTNGAFVAELIGNQYPAARLRFERMVNWNETTGLDLQSFKSDPLFANAATGDFHPRSRYGRYVSGSGYTTNVSDGFSPLIDTGDQTAPFSLETDPDGLRANLGIYGNSSQSSISPTNGSVQVLTFRDGGASSGEITLRWAASGPAAAHLVTLEFSNDGGASWTNIASNIVASTQTYLWDSEPYGRAAAGLWRVYSQTDTNVISRTDRFFALRQGGTIPYYINDSATAGDVFCTVPGNNANNGFLPSTPKATLQALLDDIDLEPGDIVYMDTGTYSVNLDTLWGELDGGTATNPVVLRGSTNTVAGGTVMDRITSLGNALLISSVAGVSVEDMIFINGAYGIAQELSQNIQVRRVTARNNARAGIRVAGSSPVLVENCLMWNNTTNGLIVDDFNAQQQTQPGDAIMRNNTIWGSQFAVSIESGGSADLRNNLIRVNGPDSRVYYLAIGVTNITADYNAYYRQSGALMAERVIDFGGNEFIAKLLDWQRDQGNDLHSLSHDPLVANSGAGDFHLLSANGRVLPSGALTNDAPGVFSPLIDTGDPASTWTNEIAPNGSRVNIGRFGNTPEASRSSTNTWLLVLTLNDGGRIAGTQTIFWAAGNWPTSSTVRIEYANNGVDFGIVASNIPVYAAAYTWNVSGEPITQFARWKVVSEADPGNNSVNQTPFVIKNQPLVVYVNDSDTSGDVYTLAQGSETNSGITPLAPLNDPGSALERFPFSEGDSLYIDTGTYYSTNSLGLRIGLIGDILKGGLPGDPIRIIGSTNRTAGGSVISSFVEAPYGIHVFKTAHISLESLRFTGFSNGVLVADSEAIEMLDVSSYDNAVGYAVDNVISARFDRCLSWKNERYGLTVQGSFSSVAWDRGIMWSNRIAAVRHVFGPLSISNSILVSATNSLLYEINSGFAVNRGDYNLYMPVQSTAMMRDELGGVTYDSVRSWQRARGMDTNSFVTDPLFYNPGAGDFHLRSDEGRYDPFFDIYLKDTNTSWAIDAGALSQSFDEEPNPNGSRLNIGRFGNTAEASLSSTNLGLFVVSLRDGGTMASPQPLIWLTRGLVTTNTVRIEYTPNDGIEWFVLATNVPALDRNYLWNNNLLESTPLARWRVTLEGNSSIADTSAVSKIRNGSILYYVNDSNLTGDVYTAAQGSEMNNGITVSTPVHSVKAIIDRFQLEGGDVIYVDTGYYEITNNIIIRGDDSGLSTSRVVICGSTNLLDGGSRMFRTITEPWSNDDANTNSVFELIRVQYIEISQLLLENANIGIFINDPLPQFDHLYLNQLEIRDGGFFGIKSLGSFENTFERILIHRMAGRGIVGKGSSAQILSSVVWSNLSGSVEWSGGALSISNSMLHAYGSSITNSVLAISKSSFKGDYNNYFNEGSSSYISLDGEPILGIPQWSLITTQDYHTISVDPLFADTTNNNFHLRSAAGRFDPVSQTFLMSDTNYSWLIDTGDPGAAWTNEPSPNGARINIGRYGGTEEASKSRGDPWLLAVTAMAGGRVGGFFPLHWFYGNLDATNRVHLDYSVDGGTNWYAIASNVLITVDGYLWNSLDATPFYQSPTTKWRVSLASDTNVMDETDRTFGLNGPFRFFVNDALTTGDVFTTTIGDDNNLGISSNAPKATLREILDSWDMDPADFVYIDTGNYLFDTNDFAFVRINNRGDADNPVTIYGSPNGSVLDGSDVSEIETVRTLLEIEAPFIHVDQVGLRRGAIEAAGTNIVLRNMRVEFGIIKLLGQFGILESFFLTNGAVQASGADMIVRSGYVRDGSLELSGARASLENTVVAGNLSPLVIISGTNVSLINNTLVADRTAIVQEGADSRSDVHNNIIVANGALGNAFAIERRGGVVVSDYNLFEVRNGAWFGNSRDGSWERLIYWQEQSGGDLNSIAADPLFADEGGGDFHLKSLAGRFLNDTWVTDVVHSVAIDAGAPSDDFSGEPPPNGGRINIGAYGNTEEASRSVTTPWLFAVTMNDGGVIRGTNILRWLAGSMDATNKVTIQYSYNAGSNWVTIATGLSALDGSFSWDTTTASNSLDALWRVVLEGDPAVLDQTDSIFNIRNDIRDFYVNNASTNGNVFTTAPGSQLNDGRTPATPKATLEDLLATYDTEPYDTIYVDTGVYTSSVINVIWSRSGDSNANMTIRGSTNFNAGGTVIRRPNKLGDAMTVDASYITLRDLIFENATRGLFIQTNRFVLAEQIVARSNLTGVVIDGGNNHRIRSSRIWGNEVAGIDVQHSDQVTIENITFVNNHPFSVIITNTPNSAIQNNIFYHDVATSNAQSAIVGNTGTVFTTFIDYNVYYFGPLASSNTTIFGLYTNLLRWQRERFLDYRSSITNPLFVSVASNNFFLQNEAGRYDPGVNAFVNDTNTSWAIDKGNPYTDFSNEPLENGGRVNIGAYGNTIYASKGTTNETVYARTGNEYLPITESENPYPLIWHTLNLPFDKVFSVQYSGDGGTEWITLQSGVNAYQEYIVWTNSPTYNSFNARWRLLEEGPGVTNAWDINDGQIRTFFGIHRISSIRAETNGANAIVWRGAWNEDYQIQFATNFFATNKLHNWQNSIPVTNLTIGGDITFTDLQSTQNPFRVYRVIWLGTNGIPYQ